MLNHLFVSAVENTRSALDWFLPYYPFYIIAVFPVLAACLSFTAIRSGVKDLRRLPAGPRIINFLFLAGLFLFICLGHRAFIIYTDERLYLQQAVEYTKTGHLNYLLSDSIMPLFFAPILKLGGLPGLKAVIFLFLSLHFLLWKLILEDALKVDSVLSAFVIFLCAAFCMSRLPDIVPYMCLGYVLSSAAAYLTLTRSFSDKKGYLLPPFIALLAIMFRKECVVLFPFILISLLFSRSIKKGMPPLLLAFVLALPVLYSHWRYELKMNAEPFDRELVTACYSSGRPIQECYTPGLSPDRSYMINILMHLSRAAGLPKEKVIALAEETYNTSNPSPKNVYYNLKFRDRLFGIISGAALLSMLIGIVLLRSRRRALALLACLAALYFSIFYLQKYSVSQFERFYFYLLPLYCCFFAILIGQGIKVICRYLQNERR